MHTYVTWRHQFAHADGLQYIPRNMHTVLYNHNKAQQSKNRVHISWDILYDSVGTLIITFNLVYINKTSF